MADKPELVSIVCLDLYNDVITFSKLLVEYVLILP